jgi:hypothetical protein
MNFKMPQGEEQKIIPKVTKYMFVKIYLEL